MTVLSDGPQLAVFVQGNSHKLLNSTVRDVVQQCNDCGSYYFGRDWTYRGMEISGCNFSLPGPVISQAICICFWSMGYFDR